MNKLDDINYLHQLYDSYGMLLTDKQRDNFELYYFEDLSLAEIAQNLNISRNAVHNNIKSTVTHLNNYENILKIVEKKKKLNDYIIKLENDMIVDEGDIEKLKELL